MYPLRVGTWFPNHLFLISLVNSVQLPKSFTSGLCTKSLSECPPSPGPPSRLFLSVVLNFLFHFQF